MPLQVTSRLVGSGSPEVPLAPELGAEVSWMTLVDALFDKITNESLYNALREQVDQLFAQLAGLYS